jgi:hypothetical protein
LVNRFLEPAARIGEGKNAYKILVSVAKKEKNNMRLRIMLVDNIKIDLEEMYTI